MSPQPSGGASEERCQQRLTLRSDAGPAILSTGFSVPREAWQGMGCVRLLGKSLIPLRHVMMILGESLGLYR